MDMFAAQNRAKCYTLFSLCGAALFLLGVSLGFAVSSKAPAQEAQAAPTPLVALTPSAAPVEAARVDAIGEAGVHPQAQVMIQTVFESCGHAYPQKSGSIVGCTQSDLNEMFPGYTVEEFSRERVVLRQQRPGYCPAHLILTIADGKTVIMQTDPESLQSERIIDPTWDVSGADEALLAQLQAGIAFEELAQIDEFIENLES
ncbi:MAG: hypothetical protein Q4E65_09215 [Clostridia bacterium]|nr:hypothetical protein [Clostridia bacterium]